MDLGLIDQAKEFEHAGMIDWLTLKLPFCHLSPQQVDHLKNGSSRMQRISYTTGEIEWETYAWDTVKSDTHQVCARVGDEYFHIQGSPARVGLPNNAFGALDIHYCAQKMIRFVRDTLGIFFLPSVRSWECSRIDITRNYLMQSEAEARQALAYLKQSPESRQKHSFEENGFYIGKRSTFNKGKIYLKGQDARRNQRRGTADYTDDQLDKADRLLRAELTLARHAIYRLESEQGLRWYELSPAYLLERHAAYFEEYFSEIEVTDMGTIFENLQQVAPTDGQARSAYDCYVRIRMTGYEQAKETFTKPSWYRHIKHLKAAGLKRADLQMINVIPLQKRAIQVAEPVRHWDDIRVG